MHALQKELITRWYKELHGVWLRQQASEAVPLPGPGATGAVPLMISGNCVELLQAFDLLPVYPEINALQLAIRKKALEYLLKAEDMGYSTDN